MLLMAGYASLKLQALFFVAFSNAYGNSGIAELTPG